MKALTQPLLPQHVNDKKAAWRHTRALLWHSARPRGALDCLLLSVVLVLLVLSKLLNLALPLVLRQVINTLSEGDTDATF